MRPTRFPRSKSWCGGWCRTFCASTIVTVPELIMAHRSKRGKTWYGHGMPYVTQKRLPGHLIAIEGTDGVGRSTQIELLRPWLELEGYAVSNTGWTRSPLLHETIEEAK